MSCADRQHTLAVSRKGGGGGRLAINCSAMTAAPSSAMSIP
jgi:hypothetical protein